LSAVLSVVYFGILKHQQSDPALSCKYAPFGFCVTNYAPDEMKCPDPTENSHVWAFRVDVLFTIGVLSIGVLPIGRKLFPMQQSRNNAIILAVVIIAHGVLHFWLGNSLSCAPPPNQGDNAAIGVKLYALFIFVLAIVAFLMSSSVKLAISLIFSLIFTWLIVTVSVAEMNIGAIFGGTQLLVSVIAAFFPKNPDDVGNEKQGWFFIAPCVISLCELLFCCDGSGDQGLFNKVGGHVWYDITLHTALIVGQLTPPYITPPKQQDF
jgi:hypothetical protein